MVGFLIAVLSGVLMSLQGVFNTEVTKQSSLWTTALLVHLTGMLVCIFAWLLTDRTSLARLFAVRPIYLLTGGLLGAFITYTVVVSMGKMGPALAVMFIVTAQLISAYLIELFGLFGTEKQPLDVRKLVGMAIAIAGVVIFKWK